MTPEIFNRYLKNPSLLDGSTVDDLWALVKEYPYFQVGRMLLARNLHNIGHEAYPLALRLAAAYAGDRSKLQMLIHGYPGVMQPLLSENELQVNSAAETVASDEVSVSASNEIPETEISTAVSEEETLPEVYAAAEISAVLQHSVRVTETTEATETTDDEVIEAGSNEPDMEAVKHNPLIDSIFMRLSSIEVTEQEPEAEITRSGEPVQDDIPDPKALARNELVDKFIREEPRISAPKREFFSPEDKARQSTSLPEDLVSETLAKIYEQQGLFNMAVKIYEKLMLLIPEKSSYFAARIDEIEKKRK
mgnify:CR=1 FL=1